MAVRADLGQEDSKPFAIESLPLSLLLCEFSHDLDEVRLAFESNARDIRHDDPAVLHPDAVREPTIGLEQVRVAFIAAQAESRSNVQRHLMSPVRHATARRPTGNLENFQRPLIFAQPVRQSAIEL